MKTKRSEGWNDPQIALFLREKGYLTPRGKNFEGKHVWSMIKKYEIRESKRQIAVLKAMDIEFKLGSE
ncbi:MAG: hypothetical protein PF441_04285 [Desulfuromusa sp.]|jgi:hypothetical protein|nr:hypothetical protein [Desulfuromusa sp.]